jgi:elongation factor Ts
LGKIGVLVALEGGNEQVGKQICIAHCCKQTRVSGALQGLSQELIAREKQIFVEQARSSGKPDNVIEKMIEGGRMRKFYEQVVLTEQAFVMAP